MCGIAGFILTASANAAQPADALASRACAMATALTHRGPDDAGEWVDVMAGVGLGHRRLSILDLSAAGHQPMHSDCGRYVLSFNGEIYNHLELRAALEEQGAALHWRGHSDTETLLAGFAHWGVEATLQKAVGMFALALWDRQERKLILARDRFGEKPLYYGWAGDAFVFGSELKALRAYPAFTNPVCRAALAQYLRLMYVPAPHSIYEGIYKLEPGCLLTLNGVPPATAPAAPLQAPETYAGIQLTRWWALGDVAAAGVQSIIADEGEALALLEQQLSKAVKAQSLADVPLGAFLSGGVDSSLIVALMQRQATRAVKTFTIGFEERAYDESPHARAVAAHIGTDHHELIVTASEAQAIIPQLPEIYDEPFADSSQIPTHLVSRMARQQVTVALSGDAGDELFGGYTRYSMGPRLWNRIAHLPAPLRHALGKAILAMPVKSWDALAKGTCAVLPGADRFSRLGDKAHKLGARLSSVNSIDELYESLISETTQATDILIGGEASASDPLRAFLPPLPHTGLDDPAARMMYWDSLTYLPGDILCKVDRAAMAVGLETRVPFLDHRVAELAWRLPNSMKIRGGQGKWALRQILYKYVPQNLIERPKTGFGIPVGQWLRGPLREWAEALLDEDRLQREGYFDAGQVRIIWHQHLTGGYDWTTRLWSVLMFQAWLERNTVKGT